MRILIVSQYFWPENFRVNDLALSLKKDKGYEVDVLTGVPNYPEGVIFEGYGFWHRRCEEYEGIRIFRVPLIPRGKNSKMQLAANFISFALSASLIGPFVCNGRYDIILVAQYSPVTMALPAILLKKIKRAPLFLWVQDLWPESLSATGAVHSSRILGLVSGLVRFIYKRCDRILVQSRAFSSRIRELSEHPVRIDYMPNWAEELYKPSDPDILWAKKMALPQGFRVMFAGNIGAAQDFGTILSAAERLREHRDIHWVVLGDGRARAWVEQEIDRRGLGATVHLLGRYPMEEMPRFFAFADGLLVTLKKEPIFALTIPGKVQSYLACARPILSVLDGEGRRVIEESGAGLACAAESPDDLAQNVLALYRLSDEKRREMGENGRRYYEENFARKTLIDRLDAWMKEEVDRG